MIHKLIKHMKIIQIGRKYFIYIILISFFTSCDIFKWDSSGYYSFSSHIVNKTEDSVRIILYNEESLYALDTTLSPDAKILHNGAREVGKDDDVLTQYLFHDYYNESYILEVYRKDSLIESWYGPARFMGDSVHHFYNYDSWDVTLIDYEYILEFTIYE